MAAPVPYLTNVRGNSISVTICAHRYEMMVGLVEVRKP